MNIDSNLMRVWRQEYRLPFLSLRSWLLLLIIPILFFSERIYNRSIAASPLRLEDIPELPIKGIQRLLVIAPHPDDETLGAGGAIQAALAQGAEVKIVMMTNGDGQAVAPLLLRREIRPRPINYIATGEQRQAEVLAALKQLGLSEDSILFLGYPDRGLNALWESNWKQECPLQATYTRATRSPYVLTFNPEARYCGHDLLSDLWTIISDYLPDMILMPHPNDEHADHRAAANFTRLAVSLKRAVEPNYQPEMWGYLIHFGDYPQPRGLYPTRLLLPPAPLTGDDSEWTKLNLTPPQIQVKARAVQAFPTQQFLLGSFLPSFVRQDEIFARISLLELLPVAYTEMDLFETELQQQPFLSEPAQDWGPRLLLPGADLVGLKVGRLGNRLWLMAETRGSLLPGLRYRLLIKLPDGRTEAISWPGQAQRLSRSIFSAHIDLDTLDNPQVLGFAAEIRQQVTLDQTAWRFMILRDILP
jgi:LmbE family N-acetylglucosaminyl deacetylase